MSHTPSEARTDPVGFLCAHLEKLLLILQDETESPGKGKVIRGITAATEVPQSPRAESAGQSLGLNSITERGFGAAKSILNSWIGSNQRCHHFLG